MIYLRRNDDPRRYPTIVDIFIIQKKRLKYFWWQLFGHNWVHSPWFPWPNWWKNKNKERSCDHYLVGYRCGGKEGNCYKMCSDCNKKLARYENNQEIETYV